MKNNKYVSLIIIAVCLCFMSGCRKNNITDLQIQNHAQAQTETADTNESISLIEENSLKSAQETEESEVIQEDYRHNNNSHTPPQPTRSPEKIQEIEEGKKIWKEIYPAGNIIWFEVDCHDGLEHIYYATKGMPLEIWLGSRYNVDKWQKDGRNIIDVTCNIYMLTNGYDALSYALTEGEKIDTDFYTSELIYEDAPEARTGEAMLKYIEDFDEGVAVADGNIAVTDVDEGLKIASRTIYAYDNGILQSITTTFYCEDSISESYEDYLSDLGIYESISKIGNNSYKCVMPEEYVAKYLDYSRATMRQILVDKFNYEHSF